MKKALLLNCLMLLIPFNASAHGGHTADAAVFSHSHVLGIAAPICLGLVLAVVLRYRRRITAGADD